MINRTQPFDLVIENQYKDQATPVLYIVSYPRENDDSQNIRFRFVNRSGQDIVLNGSPDITEDALSRNYHFALVFRPGTIHYTKDKADIQQKFTDALDTVQTSAWVVSKPISQADSTEIIYLTYRGENPLLLAAGDDIHQRGELNFMVKGLSAAAATGSRSTQVQLHYREPVGTDSVVRVRNQHLDVINHDGKTFAPLDFLVLGAPTLIHGSNDNLIRLQVVETNGRRISVSEHTTIQFKFPYYSGNYDPNYHPAWVFGSKDLVNRIAFQSDQEETTNLILAFTRSIDYAKWGYLIHTYQFTKTESIDDLILQFLNVPADGPIGDARITASVRDLPGYWDTDFEIKLDKTLLSTQYYEPWKRSYGMLSDQVILGKSLPNGWQMANAMHSSLSVTSANIKDETPESEIDKLVSLHDSKVGMDGLYISVGNWDKGQEWQDWMQGGRNGTEPLRPEQSNTKGFLIHADQYNYGTRFSVDFSGKVNADGDITSNGRVKDKTGDVMPVGAIIAYGGNSAPLGWLLCNGSAVPDGKQFDELRKLVEKEVFETIYDEEFPYGVPDYFLDMYPPSSHIETKKVYNVPDLRNRFIVGAGTDYKTGDLGGAKTVTLTTEQLPSHTHDINNGNLWVHHISFDEDSDDVERTYKSNTGGKEGDLHVRGTNATGSNQPHENMPPFYALTYIIKY